MDLSVTQQKILKLLAINCRFSNKDIAKCVGVSPDTVNYQINKLITKEKLGTFYTQFDYRMAGFNHSHYLVRLKDVEKLDIEPLKKLKFVTFINTSQGKYDLQLILAFKNDLDLEKNIQQVNDCLGNNIQDFSTMRFVSQLKYTQVIPSIDVPVQVPKKQKNVVYDLNKENFVFGDAFDTISLDKLDYGIIKELVKNPRVSFLELGKKLHKSHETIKYRISNYVRKRFISNFGCLQDYKNHGYYANYLFLKLKNYDRELFKEWLGKNQRIFYAAHLLGEYNCIVYILSRTPDEFSDETKRVRDFFGEALLDQELLYYKQTEKNVQFPEVLFDQQ